VAGWQEPKRKKAPFNVAAMIVVSWVLQVLALVVTMSLAWIVRMPVDVAATIGFGLAVIGLICFIAAFSLTEGPFRFTRFMLAVVLMYAAPSVGLAMIMAGLPMLAGLSGGLCLFAAGFITGTVTFFRHLGR
jgi:hypothetical protein